MKIALDLDNTITADKNSIGFFSILTSLLINEHKIYIITNREIGTEQEIAEELKNLGIEYSEIVITDKKAEYIKENNITIYYDNQDENYLELGPEVVVFKIRESGNFSFVEKNGLEAKKPRR